MSKRSASEYLNNDELWDTIDRYDKFDELDQDLDSNTINKISNLVNYIFNPEVTGFEVEMDKYKDRRNGNNTLSFGVKRDKTPHWFEITLTALKDEYFRVYVKLPFMSDEGNNFSIVDQTFLIDGWDGLKEWASDTQIAKGGCDFVEILSLQVPDIRDMQQERYSDYDMIKSVKSKYPSLTIDDRTYYFKKVDNKFVPYGASIRYSNSLYIYKNEEEKAEQKRLKTEHDRLYNIYFNLRFRGNKTRMENDLTQEEDRMLMRLLNNSNLRGPVEGSYDTFKNEEDHQTALKLVDKLVKTSRPITESNTEGLKYLKVFKGF
jgi:hypothetical protein